MINSKSIMKQLQEKVIGQDEYVKQLSVLGFKHELNQELIRNGKDPVNNNLLVVGPTGSGKTFAAKELARILDTPFYEVDCSNVVQTGYRGMTCVDHILKDAVNRLHSGVLHSIIYLDEFDKVYDQSLDVRGEGTAQQQNYLKLLEPNEIVFDRESRYGDRASFLNTAGITFIATGSFDFVRRKMKSRKQKMGVKVKEEGNRSLTREDIIAAGFIPELIGRFGTIINLNELNRDDYYRILLNSKDSAYTRFQDFFRAVDVSLNISETALRSIAEEAYNKKVGARGLSDVLGNTLTEAVFRVSSDRSISEVEISLKEGEIIADYRHEKKKKRKKDELTEQRERVANTIQMYAEKKTREVNNG